MNFKTWRLRVLALAFLLPLAAWAEVLTVDETDVPIRVDGHLSTWPAARMILLGQSSQVVFGKSFWKNPEDFNGRVFITYDSQFLYIAAIVQKKGAVVNSNEKLSLWNGDCLEIYLSTHSRPQDLKRVSGGEYRIGLSPGTSCANPQAFCLNKNKEITGARVIARTTKTGYVLEACVPLSFFGGLEIGPGKNSAFNVVLDEGGPISGNRTLQLDYLGLPMSWDKPVSWATIQWVGKDEISVPDTKTEDLYANLVQDGTKGSTYLGSKSIQGNVTDPKGKPLPGVRISTWPRSKEVVTDSKGQFKIEKIKFYDKSVLYGRLDGYVSSLCPRPSKAGPVSLVLNPIPKGVDATGNETSPYFYGKSFRLSSQGAFEPDALIQKGNEKGIHLNVLRLCGTENVQGSLADQAQMLDRFLLYAKGAGAEPIIELPIRQQNPASVADWVRYCNITKKYGVRFWTIGNEPDVVDAKGEESNYSAYDYINDFRVIYNAIKTIDPSIIVLGPELAWKYRDGENDWLTPFLQYDGDIVNMVSIHRYAAVTPDQNTSKVLMAGLRSESVLISNLRDEISSLTDVFVPLLVTGSNGNLKASISPAGKGADEAGPQSFWSALWTADQLGTALNEKLGMDLFSPFKTVSPLASLAAPGPVPSDWAFELFGMILKGKTVPAQIQKPDILVYATQDFKTKNVFLLIVNKGDRYYRPKIMLNGKDGDLTVEAGLDMRVDYEIPYFSISVLKINADNSPGEVVRYTSKLAETGQAPETLVLKPW